MEGNSQIEYLLEKILEELKGLKKAVTDLDPDVIRVREYNRQRDREVKRREMGPPH